MLCRICNMSIQTAGELVCNLCLSHAYGYNTTHWVKCASSLEGCPVFPGDTKINREDWTNFTLKLLNNFNTRLLKPNNFNAQLLKPNNFNAQVTLRPERGCIACFSTKGGMCGKHLRGLVGSLQHEAKSIQARLKHYRVENIVNILNTTIKEISCNICNDSGSFLHQGSKRLQYCSCAKGIEKGKLYFFKQEIAEREYVKRKAVRRQTLEKAFGAFLLGIIASSGWIVLQMCFHNG